MGSTLEQLRPAIIAGLSFLLALIASAHAVMRKRDSRAALGWVGVIWLVPILGAVLYALLGINRVHRRARLLRAGLTASTTLRDTGTDWRVLGGELTEEYGHLKALARVVGRVTSAPLVAGNRVVPLINGDAAYPEMLAAIEGAERSVALSTYIFDKDESGCVFADALSRAAKRGIEVRVLIDAVGARYSWPSMVGHLADQGVVAARFMQTVLPWRMQFVNLRCHRKILVADGRVAFAGGMNIRDGHVLARQPHRGIQDMQFRIEGPVVEQIMWVFAEDWAFTTREVLAGPAWFPQLREVGGVIARGIPDGPGEDFEKMRLTLLGGIQTANHRICIVTPYFLPDRDLISGLTIAALRGVEVEVVLPAVNNQPMVQWASNALLWQLLERGCRVYTTPLPFDHTKLMVVDDAWTLLGSANWDPRSLRLNFEFNVECYDNELASAMSRLVTERIAGAHQVTKAEVDGRPLLLKLRDGVVRLGSPYL